VPLFGGGCLRALGMWSLILAQAFAYGNFRGMLDPTLPLTYRDHGVENPSELRLDPPFSKRKNNLWPLESRGPIGNFSEIASKLSFRAPRKLGINARLSTPLHRLGRKGRLAYRLPCLLLLLSSRSTCTFIYNILRARYNDGNALARQGKC
jgi:hypothetical protein